MNVLERVVKLELPQEVEDTVSLSASSVSSYSKPQPPEYTMQKLADVTPTSASGTDEEENVYETISY